MDPKTLPPVCLEDETGTPTLFAWLDILTHKGNTYALLTPQPGDGKRVTVLQLLDPNDPDSLTGVEDPALSEEVFALYTGRLRMQAESGR